MQYSPSIKYKKEYNGIISEKKKAAAKRDITIECNNLGNEKEKKMNLGAFVGTCNEMSLILRLFEYNWD